MNNLKLNDNKTLIKKIKMKFTRNNKNADIKLPVYK